MRVSQHINHFHTQYLKSFGTNLPARKSQFYHWENRSSEQARALPSFPKPCKQKDSVLQPSSPGRSVDRPQMGFPHPLEQEEQVDNPNITLLCSWCENGRSALGVSVISSHSHPEVHKQPLLHAMGDATPFQIQSPDRIMMKPTVQPDGAASRSPHCSCPEPHAKGWGAREHVGVSTALPLSGQVKRVRTSPLPPHLSFRLNNYTIYTRTPPQLAERVNAEVGAWWGLNHQVLYTLSEAGWCRNSTGKPTLFSWGSSLNVSLLESPLTMTLGKPRYSKKICQTMAQCLKSSRKRLRDLVLILGWEGPANPSPLPSANGGDLVGMLYPSLVPQRNKPIWRVIWL